MSTSSTQQQTMAPLTAREQCRSLCLRYRHPQYNRGFVQGMAIAQCPTTASNSNRWLVDLMNMVLDHLQGNLSGRGIVPLFIVFEDWSDIDSAECS